MKKLTLLMVVTLLPITLFSQLCVGFSFETTNLSLCYNQPIKNFGIYGKYRYGNYSYNEGIAKFTEEVYSFGLSYEFMRDKRLLVGSSYNNLYNIYNPFGYIINPDPELSLDFGVISGLVENKRLVFYMMTSFKFYKETNFIVELGLGFKIFKNELHN